jgi:hypothetical protein
MINGSMFPTMMQHSDSKQPLTGYLNSIRCQSCVAAAAVYRSGLKNAVLMIRRRSWLSVQRNVRCVGSYLDRL